jgi:uncharacterized protein (TIGR03118 family)
MLPQSLFNQEEAVMKSVARFRWVFAALLALLVPSLTFAQHYNQTNLVSDQPGVAPVTDPNLVNPWGLARSTTSPWWVSDNGTGLSTLYSGAGVKSALTVTVPVPPPPPTDTNPSTPTGVVFNGSATDFLLPTAVPSKFIFATEDGTVSGWNSGTTAVIVINNSSHGAVYKGITTGDVNGNRYLYVSNFHSGHVEVYDTKFNRVHFSHDGDDHGRFWDKDDDGPFSRDSFDDDSIPDGYAPFNVQNIGGSIFVTYAKQDRARHDDVAGAGFGFVDVYTTSGKLERRLEHGPWFSSPWGVVWAPRDFGEFSNRVLVGNFGSGQIAAFDGFSGKFIGLMKTYTDPVHLTGEQTVTIDGLWALTFGNSAFGVVAATGTGSAGPYNSLFFTAGPDGESHGLFGTLTAISGEQDGDEE